MAERLRAAVLGAGIPVLNENSPLRSTAEPDVLLVGLSNSAPSGPIEGVSRHPGGPLVLLVLARGVPPRHEIVSQADDFTREPLDEQELATRLALLFERRGPGGGRMLRAGEITVDLDRYEVRLGGLPIDLTPKEYQLLCYLVERAGRACTRQQLLEAVWGYDYFGGMRTVDIHVQRLRAKLGDQAGATIETVRSVGYRLRE